IGLLAGIMSGFFGIGGGILIIPLLMLTMGYNQLTAQGTSLGVLLAPIGIFAFLEYYRNPAVQLNLIGIAVMALIFAGGAYFGGRWANSLDVNTMRRVFSVFLAVVAVY